MGKCPYIQLGYSLGWYPPTDWDAQQHLHVPVQSRQVQRGCADCRGFVFVSTDLRPGGAYGESMGRVHTWCYTPCNHFMGYLLGYLMGYLMGYVLGYLMGY